MIVKFFIRLTTGVSRLNRLTIFFEMIQEKSLVKDLSPK